MSMPENEKPLHVLVAEKLGWMRVRPGGIMVEGAYVGYPPEGLFVLDHPEQVPWYDSDWSATGPLIERLGIELSKGYKGQWYATVYDRYGNPSCLHIGESSGFAPCGCAAATPLLAVCNLILALLDEVVRGSSK